MGDIPSSLGGLVFCKDISSAKGERFLELLQFKKKDSPIIYCVGWGPEWTKMGPISQGYLDISFKKPFSLIPPNVVTSLTACLRTYTATCPIIALTLLHRSVYTVDQAFPFNKQIQRQSDSIVNSKIYRKPLRFYNLRLYFVVTSLPPPSCQFL